MSENEELEVTLLRRLADEARKEVFEAVDARNSDRIEFEGQIAEIERNHSRAIELREKMLRALEGRVRERDEELDRQRRESRKFRRALDEAHASTSWKVTRPVRAISQLLKRLRS